MTIPFSPETLQNRQAFANAQTCFTYTTINGCEYVECVTRGPLPNGKTYEKCVTRDPVTGLIQCINPWEPQGGC